MSILTGAGRALAFFAAGALAASPTATAAQQNAVGVNAAIQNVVQVRRGATPARRAVLKERVFLGDRIGTAAQSRLQIMLLDRSVFTVGPNANIGIDRFVYDPARNTRSGAVSVTKGAFRFMSGGAAKRPIGNVGVRTPVASIGIRGTIFEGAVGEDAIAIARGQPALAGIANADPETATLVVLRGPGPNTQGDTRPGEIDVTAGDRTITLNQPGQAVFVPRAGAAPVQFEISQAGLEQLQGLLRTIPSFAGGVPGGAQDGPAGPDQGGPGDTGTPRGDQTPPAGPDGSPQGTPAPRERVGGGGGGGSLLIPLAPIAATILGVVLLTGEDEPESP